MLFLKEIDTIHQYFPFMLQHYKRLLPMDLRTVEHNVILMKAQIRKITQIYQEESLVSYYYYYYIIIIIYLFIYFSFSYLLLITNILFHYHQNLSQ